MIDGFPNKSSRKISWKKPLLSATCRGKKVTFWKKGKRETFFSLQFFFFLSAFPIFRKKILCFPQRLPTSRKKKKKNIHEFSISLSLVGWLGLVSPPVYLKGACCDGIGGGGGGGKEKISCSPCWQNKKKRSHFPLEKSCFIEGEKGQAKFPAVN